MKECELCGVRARMYCEADRASLCWDCDEKVHGANFLVAKHPRVLLCHVCQSQTPWTSCGAKLTPTVSVCQSCVGSCRKIDLNEEQESEAENEEEEEDYYDDEDEEDDDVEDEEEEDENQVVPWSCCSYSPAQRPPAVSGSDSEAEISVSKRLRENVDVDYSDDEVGFDGTSSFGGSMRPLKRPKVGEEKNGDGDDGGESEWRATAIMSSIQKLEKEVINGAGNASTAVLRICKLSRDESSH
ncbi:putative transcription factor interactor and regulator Znf-B family [Rosa chinensis]|uniref:BBX28 n=2 Tax=Rosa TaxID=3764 RepID=A0A8K1NC92_ROSHC|nr:zinc finger protein CONSTANS-LIKE 4 [Rosa chinensis]PRQ31512.1 putative transcription factor interactor and regulator Znf-B family [Rosa chinensis]UCU84643.1 BBX28 [Rosa hybrid cultivar]